MTSGGQLFLTILPKLPSGLSVDQTIIKIRHLQKCLATDPIRLLSGKVLAYNLPADCMCLKKDLKRIPKFKQIKECKLENWKHQSLSPDSNIQPSETEEGGMRGLHTLTASAIFLHYTKSRVANL